jgi:flavin-dependent dehydrogenase
VTARELARRGCKVLLVDKSAFPRPKVCGCCINGAAIRSLERLGLGHVLEGAVALERLSVSAGRLRAELALSRGVTLSREAFDVRLLYEAMRAGVEFRPGVMINHNSDLPTRARLTIVATGLAGADASADRESRIGAGAVLPVEAVPRFYGARAIYMAVGRRGYVGLVQVEDGRLDVAAAFDPSFVKETEGPGAAAELVLRGVGWPVPRGLVSAVWKGTPALTRHPMRVAGHRLFRVGDAAGYVEPFTGEGLAWAVMTAAAVAPIAVRAVRGWDESIAREWENVYRRLIGPRQRLCRMVARGLRSPILTGLAIRILGIAPVLAQPVIAALNRPASHGLAA